MFNITAKIAWASTRPILKLMFVMGIGMIMSKRRTLSPEGSKILATVKYRFERPFLPVICFKYILLTDSNLAPPVLIWVLYPSLLFTKVVVGLDFNNITQFGIMSISSVVMLCMGLVIGYIVLRLTNPPKGFRYGTMRFLCLTNLFFFSVGYKLFGEDFRDADNSPGPSMMDISLTNNIHEAREGGKIIASARAESPSNISASPSLKAVPSIIPTPSANAVNVGNMLPSAMALTRASSFKNVLPSGLIRRESFSLTSRMADAGSDLNSYNGEAHGSNNSSLNQIALRERDERPVSTANAGAGQQKEQSQDALGKGSSTVLTVDEPYGSTSPLDAQGNGKRPLAVGWLLRPTTKPSVSPLKKVHISEETWFWIKALGNLANIATIVGLIVAVSSPLKALFIEDKGSNGGEPPFLFVFETLKFLGDAAVPLGLVNLGAALGRLNIRSLLPIRITLAIAFARLILFPTIGFLIITQLVNARVIDPEDKIMRFVLMSCLEVPNKAIQITKMKEIPDEILIAIFAAADFASSFRSVILVNKIWHRVAFDAKRINVTATPAVKKLTLDVLLRRFPVVEDLVLTPSSRNLEFGPDLIHEIAKQFTGHPTLRRIFCGSDFIVPGALEGCPRMEHLNLSYLHTWFNASDGDRDELGNFDGEEEEDEEVGNDGFVEDGHRESTSSHRRNLAGILKRGKALRVLDIESATFWHRGPRTDFLSNSMRMDGEMFGLNLEVLKLGNFSGWSLQNFTIWLGKAGSGGLPVLKEFRLDADYLNLPQQFIRNLAIGCPSLKSLRIKYANLAPMHMIEMADQLPNLELLSLGKCEIWFYPSKSEEHAKMTTALIQQWQQDGEESAEEEILASNGSSAVHFVSYSELVHHLTASMRNLECLHFNQNTLHALASPPPHSRSLRNVVTSHPLQSLKVFDTNETRPTSEQFEEMLGAFPHLQTLRLDVPVLEDIRREGSRPRSWSFIHELLPNLKVLELRCAKPKMAVGEDAYSFHVKEEESSLIPSTKFGKISTLAVWSTHPSSLPRLLSLNAATLTTLTLNYLPGCSMSQDSYKGSIPLLPSLKTLAIKTLTHVAVFDAMYLLDAILGEEGCPSLRNLTMEALHRSPLPPVNVQELISVATRTPSLTSLKLNNLKLPKEIFGKIRGLWKALESLEVVGRFGGVGVIADHTWVESFDGKGFRSLIESKPCLKIIRMHLEGVNVDFDMTTSNPVSGSRNPIPESITDSGTSHHFAGVLTLGPVLTDSVEIGDVGWRQRFRKVIDRRVADMSGYRMFSEWIAARWPHLQEVDFTGPLSGSTIYDILLNEVKTTGALDVEQDVI
ncbi:Protein M3 [Dinochytrium kinnereticum]|nr:Protein M3 [Dinochytrium kinnereticum]